MCFYNGFVRIVQLIVKIKYIYKTVSYELNNFIKYNHPYKQLIIVLIIFKTLAVNKQAILVHWDIRMLIK